MATNSSIEWIESTWNLLTGCTKIRPGCKHCHAERMAIRLKAMGQAGYINRFKLTLHEDALELPLHWKKPQTIFVNSMSDIFHKSVPVEKSNPILEEVWRIKDQLAREAGYDMHRFCENLRKWTAEHPHSVPVIHNAEELRQLVAEEERKRSEASAWILKDAPAQVEDPDEIGEE